MDIIEVVLAEEAGDGPAVLKAGLFCFGLSIAFLAGSLIWLGVEGTFDPKSPDFFPLPVFLALCAFLIGIFFVVRGSLHQLRFNAFGTSTLEVSEAALGGSFRGRVRTKADIVVRGPFTARLRCDCRQTISGADGKSRETTTHLWEAKVSVGATTRTSQGLPVAFALPADGLPSGRRPRPKLGVTLDPGWIEWTLRVSAPRSGLDYVAEFPVTVKGAANPRQTAKSVEPTERGDTGDLLARAAAIGGFGASILAGGRVPTAEELADQQEADARLEPAEPFKGYVQPEQDGTRLFRRVFLVVGVLLSLGSAYSVSHQVVVSRTYDRLLGSISELGHMELGAKLANGEAAHVGLTTNAAQWTLGQEVVLACRPGADNPRRCVMVTGFDRWMGPLLGLGLGLALLAAALWLRHRARA